MRGQIWCREASGPPVGHVTKRGAVGLPPEPTRKRAKPQGLVNILERPGCISEATMEPSGPPRRAFQESLFPLRAILGGRFQCVHGERGCRANFLLPLGNLSLARYLGGALLGTRRFSPIWPCWEETEGLPEPDLHGGLLRGGTGRETLRQGLAGANQITGKPKSVDLHLTEPDTTPRETYYLG
jgi:hypothetical protein